MTTPIGDHVFLALGAGLADLRGRIEGPDGRKLAAVGHTTGFVSDLVRQFLTTVAQALTWLADALRSAAEALRVADALLAIVEVSARALDQVTQIALVGGPALLDLRPGPLGDIYRVIEGPLRGAEQVGQYVISEDALVEARAELALLLGDPEHPGPGSLGRLLAEVHP